MQSRQLRSAELPHVRLFSNGPSNSNRDKTPSQHGGNCGGGADKTTAADVSTSASCGGNHGGGGRECPALIQLEEPGQTKLGEPKEELPVKVDKLPRDPPANAGHPDASPYRQRVC